MVDAFLFQMQFNKESPNSFERLKIILDQSL
jgi:hypothetical protein